MPQLAIKLTQGLLCLSLTSASQAQLPKMEYGILAGTYIYQGDLTPSAVGSYRTPGYAFSFFAARKLSPAFSLRANLSIGQLRGDDAAYSLPTWRKERAFRFSATVAELSGLLVWYPRKNYNSTEEKKIQPYVFGGAAISFMNISRDASRFNGEYFSGEPAVASGLAEDLSRKPPVVVPVIPAGLGLEYSLSPKLGWLLQSSYHRSFTDYLDGFSKAAHPEYKDHYLHHAIGVVYKPGRKSDTDCPVLRY